MRKLFHFRGPMAALLLTAAVRVASAQSIDYGSFEQLFGEPVTTSVTGSPQRAGQVPAAMEIITADEIRRSGARDIPGVLRHVVGVDVLQWGNDAADVAVRGYNQVFSPRLLVLIDGREVYHHSNGHTLWSSLPVELDGIRQIEVVKGPNTALFGFNAVGGVVNIVTYQPVYDDVNSLSVISGTQDLRQGSLVARLKLGEKSGVRLLAGGNANDDFSTPQLPQDLATRSGNSRSAFNLRAGFGLSERLYLELEGTQSKAKYASFGSSYTTSDEDNRTSSAAALLTADLKHGLLEARVYRNAFDVKANFNNSLFDVDEQFVVAQVQDLFKIGARNTVRLAAEYRENSVGVVPLGGADISSAVWAGAAMWESKINSAFTLSNAVRIDHVAYARSGYLPPDIRLTNAVWSKRYTLPSFNSALVWTVSDADLLRLTVSRGVQMPSLVAVGGVLLQVVPGLYAGTSPSVGPTTNMQYDLGWGRMLPWLGAQLLVDGYYQSIHHVNSLIGSATFLAPNLISPATPLGNSDSYGLEVSLRGTVGDRWRWSLAYSPQRIEDHFSIPYALSLTDYEDTTPKHKLDARLGWSNAVWEFDGYAHYQSSSDGLRGDGSLQSTGFLEHIPSYVSVDARAGYRFSKRLTLAVSGQNLLHARQQQTSAPEVERRVLAKLTFSY
jgi:outer membrane receptor for ferrienterochelin and colicins